MKILQIGMGNIAGGLESFVMNYYRVLVHMDVQFDFVCMYDKIAYEDEIKKLGGKIYYIPNVDRKSTRLNSSHVRTSRMPSSA